MFDANGDGELTEKEVIEFIEKQYGKKMEPEMLKKFKKEFAEADTSGNGTVDFKEMEAAMNAS